MTPRVDNSWLHRYAVLTALVTLGLIGVGGVVTSRGVGMAVPDWPNSFGYNMFAFPVSKWVGGVFYEHSHRLVASVVGLLVVGLTRWLGGNRSRMPLALIGSVEIAAGLALLKLGPNWSGAGHFLSGIGAVVLLAGAIWARNEPAPAPLPLLGWVAFGTVQIQGLLGGLRVVLFKDELGIFHATLAQLFFALMCVIAILTRRRGTPNAFEKPGLIPAVGTNELPCRPATSRLFLAGTILIFVQLILGAAMRHQHAGLAIPDFPLAYGKLWPAMDADSVALYNQRRLEVTSVKPITATQIGLQMTHRIVALLIAATTAAAAWSARRGATKFIFKLALGWLCLILLQVLLGAATIWSDKAADIATLHVVTGALSLALGVILCIISFQAPVFVHGEADFSTAVPGTPARVQPAAATGTI